MCFGERSYVYTYIRARNLLKFTTWELLPRLLRIFGNTGASRFVIALSHRSLIRCNRGSQRRYLVGSIARLLNDRKRYRLPLRSKCNVIDLENV